MLKAPSPAITSSVQALPGAIHQCDPGAAPRRSDGRLQQGRGEKRKTDRIKITELAGPREGRPAR